MITKVLLLSALLSTGATSAENKEATGPDAQALNAACAQDGKIAGCEGEKVGTGLLKCIRAYKKAHRSEFRISEACHSAMNKAREHRQERKKERKARKDKKE